MNDPLDLLDQQHIVLLKGKRHPTYPGVLAAALKAGLKSLEVGILQFPSPDNGNCAVCEALAVFTTADGREMTFAEIGDCDDRNCGAHIAPHKLRMAATRAKGRALRDALGIGIAMAEEMHEGGQISDDQPAPRQTPTVRHEAPAPPKAPQRPPAAPNGPAGRQAPAPMAAAPPGQQTASDEDPVLRCGWLRCGKPLSDADAATSMARFKHLVCPEHLPAAADYFAKKQPVVIDIEPGADEGLIPTIAAQAQGF